MGHGDCFQHTRGSNPGRPYPDHMVLLSAFLICLVSLVECQGTGPTTDVGSMTTLQTVTTSQDGSMTTLKTTAATTTSPMTTSGSKTTSQDGPMTTKSTSRSMTTLQDEPMTSLSENTETGTEKVTDEHHTKHPPDGHHDPCEEEITHFEVVGLEWEEVMVPFSIGVWVLIASVAKLGKFSF